MYKQISNFISSLSALDSNDLKLILDQLNGIDSEKISQRIKKYRKMHKPNPLTQQQMATRMNLSLESYKRFENERKKINLRFIISVSIILEISPLEILDINSLSFSMNESSCNSKENTIENESSKLQNSISNHTEIGYSVNSFPHTIIDLKLICPNNYEKFYDFCTANAKYFI